MRPSELLAALSLLAAGCAVPLDGPYPPDAGAAAAAQAPTVSVGGCVPFRTAGVVPAGAGVSIDAGGGRSLWVFGGATGTAALAAGAGALVQEAKGLAGCFAGVPLDAVLDASLLPAGAVVTPLDVVAAGTEVFLYYQLGRLDPKAAFGVHAIGTGVVPLDTAAGRFLLTENILWSADVASYGTSAIAVGGEVFAYGCSSPAPLESDCFVAKVAPGSIADPGAYTYSMGSGRYSANLADAQAVVLDAGSSVSVRPDPRGFGLLMTYVPPLGNALAIRSALTPEGPFSAEHALGLCDLPDDPAYVCTGGNQHPEIAGASGGLVLSYAPGSLTAGTAPEPPRVAVVAIPADLP